MTLQFKKAERRQVKLKIGLSGPSGSGKTLSALLIAKGMLSQGGKIAVIDTENASASLYAGQKLPNGETVPEFDSLELDPPYTTERYLAAINAAVQEGYEVLVIDSASHQWAAEGGILSRKEQMDARGGNSFANWAKLTPEHEKFKAGILHADCHTIITLRSKQEYALVENSNGKQAPKKLGMAPIQREGLEYELTAMLDLDMSHQAQASKDRTGLFDGKLFVPSPATGKALIAWLAEAKPAEPRPVIPTPVANTGKHEPSLGGEICGTCNTPLKVTSKGDALFCPNFQDKAKGDHTYTRLNKNGHAAPSAAQRG